MYVYPLREKSGLHPNLTCVHVDRGCGNSIPGDVAETRGFALSVPKGKKVQNAQTFGNVTPTVKMCPPHPTFRTKVRARKDMPEEEKENDNYTFKYNFDSPGTKTDLSRVNTASHGMKSQSHRLIAD